MCWSDESTLWFPVLTGQVHGPVDQACLDTDPYLPFDPSVEGSDGHSEYFSVRRIFWLHSLSVGLSV